MASATEDTPSGILPGIEHVVVVMLENRSFDTLLGWLYDGASPRHYIPTGACFQFEGLSDARLPALANPLTLPGKPTLLYPPVKGASYTVEDNASYLNSPPTDPHEELQYVTDQIYGPLKWTGEPPINPPPGAKPHMKGFLQDYVSALPSSLQSDLPTILKVMETYTPDQLPVLCGLARAFACSDAWFSSAPTQTNPNRAFLACGTSLGQINNDSKNWSYGNFDTLTIWNRLQQLNVSWKIYWEEVFVPIKDSDNQGWTRKAFPQLRKISSDSDFPNMAEFHRCARAGTLPAFSFIEPSWSLEASEIGQTNGLQGDDYHPPGDVRPGEDLLAQIYTSLLANPRALEKTLLVITFDEHGGTYDHQPPPHATPPDGHQTPFAFDRYGVRVPAIFVSPFIEEQTVIRAGLPGSWPPFDHTSVAATVLKWKGLTPPQYNLGARTAGAPTFEQVLNRPRARPPEELVLGKLRQPPTAPSVRLGDLFALRYVSPGPYQGWWVGLSTWSVLAQSYYATAINDPTQAASLQFTLGGPNPPAQTVTHGSFLYVTSTESQLQGAANWMVQSDGDYERSDVFYAADTAPTVPGPGLYWTLKHADPALAAVGQPVHFGDLIYLENRYIPSLGDWLPGRLIPTESDAGYYYCALTDDPDYANPAVGTWEIVRIG